MSENRYSGGSEVMEVKQVNKSGASNIISIWLCLIAGGYLLFSIWRSVDMIDLTGIEVFNTIFISILMQAFPFMLIGVFISSAMHVFIPDEFIVKIFPTRYGLGFLTAMFVGIFLPICECAIVPVTTRLIKKGVALPIAATFMLSAPIINPIVIISTLYAFPNRPEIAILRVCFGLIIAFIVGSVLALYGNKHSMLLDEHSEHSCDCHCCSEDSHSKKGIATKIKTMFLHAGEEFFSVGKYLVIGAFMTSLIQTLVPRGVFANLSAQNGLSLFIMMATAFLFSACSTSDAFIARSFMDRFSMGSIMGFLVFGPMMDIKSILMLLGSCKKSFVIQFSILIFFANFIMLYFLAFLFL